MPVRIASYRPAALSLFAALPGVRRPLQRLATLLIVASTTGVFPTEVTAQNQWHSGCNRSGEATYCYRPFAEGMAAVQLGDLAERKPAWGYLASDGSLAIAPAFDDAESFQNGLAAVEQDGRWGYIDPQGSWAIPPRFDEAWGFNAAGTALASLDDRDVLIDRTGKILKTFPVGTRTWGFQAGQSLAMMEQASTPMAWNIATAALLQTPAGISALDGGSDNDRWRAPQWLAAQQRDSRYGGQWGILKTDGTWLATPEALRSTQAPRTDGKHVAVRRDSEWQLTDLKGEVSRSQTYQTLRLLAPGYWLGTHATAVELLGPDLRRVRAWTKIPHIKREPDWNFAVVWDGSAILLLNDDQAHVLLEMPHQSIKVEDGRIWVFQAEEESQQRSYGQSGILAQIYDHHGKPQLVLDAVVESASEPTAENVSPVTGDATAEAEATPAEAREITLAQRLQDYSVDILEPASHAPLPVDASQWPLAILTPRGYGSGLPPAILTRAGTLVSKPDWRTIRYSNQGGPLRVSLENGRVGTIDAQGNWLIAPDFSELGSFEGPYARALLPGADPYRDVIIVDSAGQKVALPTAVMNGLERIAGNVAVYREQDGRGDNRWYLWDIAAGKRALADSLQAIGNYSDGYAQAQQRGKWGLLDSQGKWVVPPTRTSAPYVQIQPGGFLLLQDEEDSSLARLLRSDGRTVGPKLSREVRHIGHGQFQVTRADTGEAAILDTVRNATITLPHTSTHNLSHSDGWVIVPSDFMRGAVDTQGNWRIAPTLTEFNPFFVQPAGIARATRKSGYFLMNEQGKQVLGGQGDLFPLQGMARVVRSNDDNDSVLLDMQGREIARVEGNYGFEVDNASEGLVPYRQRSTNKYGFMDATGKRVIGAFFDSLGPMKNGRAVAVRKDRAGRFQGYIDQSGRYAILPEFNWASEFSEGRALVLRDGLTQYIDTEGNAIAYIGMLCGHVAVISPADDVLWPGPEKLGCLAQNAEEQAADSRRSPQQQAGPVHAPETAIVMPSAMPVPAAPVVSAPVPASPTVSTP